MIRASNFILAAAFTAWLTGSASPLCSGPLPAPGTALFSAVRYAGHDSIYDSHPLPGLEWYRNPILPGWYSDPSVCSNGKGDYFLATSTFVYSPGVPLFHSRDLVNWRQVGHILRSRAQLKNLRHQHVSGGIYAPDIKYCAANGTYYMITTNVGAGNFFVKTTDPFGEWSEPVYLPGIRGIDPSFFFDDDGRAYIVNNDDAPDGKPEYPGHRTVRLQEFDLAADTCKGERIILVNRGSRPEEKPIWCEGPHVYKVGGWYYLMTAEGGTAINHSEVIYRSKDVKGPYLPWDRNPILTQRDLDPTRADAVTCAGHADLVQAADGKWWAVFLACRPNAQGYENLGRETFMLPVHWTPDGWPVILPAGESVPLNVACPGVKHDNDGQCGNFVWTDDFTSPALALQWLTLRGDACGLYSLDENPGCLTLECSDVQLHEKDVPAFIGRRLQHHDFDFEVRVTFVPADSTEQAGVAVMKDEAHQYQMAKTRIGGQDALVLNRIGDQGLYTALAGALLPWGTQTVDLRVSGRPDGFGFYYSTDGRNTWAPLAEGVDARHTSTAAAGGFTGTTVGPFAVKVIDN